MKKIHAVVLAAILGCASAPISVISLDAAVSAVESDAQRILGSWLVEDREDRILVFMEDGTLQFNDGATIETTTYALDHGAFYCPLLTDDSPVSWQYMISDDGNGMCIYTFLDERCVGLGLFRQGAQITNPDLGLEDNWLLNLDPSGSKETCSADMTNNELTLYHGRESGTGRYILFDDNWIYIKGPYDDPEGLYRYQILSDSGSIVLDNGDFKMYMDRNHLSETETPWELTVGEYAVSFTVPASWNGHMGIREDPYQENTYIVYNIDNADPETGFGGNLFALAWTQMSSAAPYFDSEFPDDMILQEEAEGTLVFYEPRGGVMVNTDSDYLAELYRTMKQDIPSIKETLSSKKLEP